MTSILPSRKHDGGHLSKETADEVLISSYTPDCWPLAPLDLWSLGLSHPWLQPDIWLWVSPVSLALPFQSPLDLSIPTSAACDSCQPPNYLRSHWDSTSGWPCPLPFFPEQPLYCPVPASHLPQVSLRRRTITASQRGWGQARVMAQVSPVTNL